MRNLLDLTGKIALVTGGSRGLGLEIVKAYAEHGADVIIASRKMENCEAVAEEVRKTYGVRAMPYQVHAGRWDEVEKMADHVYAEWGRIDILVNNAGMSMHSFPEEFTEKAFDSVMNINFKGPFHLSSIVGRRMYEAGDGAIISVSSSGAMLPLPHASVYGAAKAALNAMSLTLAYHFGPRVRSNILSAGPFLTDLAQGWDEEKRRTSGNALQRPGNPEEVISTALFLASPHSSYVTGSLVTCDGGWVNPWKRSPGRQPDFL